MGLVNRRLPAFKIGPKGGRSRVAGERREPEAWLSEAGSSSSGFSYSQGLLVTRSRIARSALNQHSGEIQDGTNLQGLSGALDPARTAGARL
jgi:hypothetical protein